MNGSRLLREPIGLLEQRIGVRLISSDLPCSHAAPERRELFLNKLAQRGEDGPIKFLTAPSAIAVFKAKGLNPG
jgi:hypothetical protein